MEMLRRDVKLGNSRKKPEEYHLNLIVWFYKSI